MLLIVAAEPRELGKQKLAQAVHLMRARAEIKGRRGETVEKIRGRELSIAPKSSTFRTPSPRNRDDLASSIEVAMWQRSERRDRPRRSPNLGGGDIREQVAVPTVTVTILGARL
jgi:hypothetical protein